MKASPNRGMDVSVMNWRLVVFQFEGHWMNSAAARLVEANRNWRFDGMACVHRHVIVR